MNQKQPHTIHHIFWASAAIAFGVTSAWLLFGGIQRVSAFFGQKENETAIARATTPEPGPETVQNKPVDNYTVDGSPARINAKSYLIADIETGEILYEHNVDTQYPIASVSKLVTGMVAYDHMDLSDIAIVSRDAANVESSRGGLTAGEKLRVLDLLYPLMLVSSNNAANVLAEEYGYDRFITQMNKTAADMGLTKTSFEDPSGLSKNNVSTASELFTILKKVHDEYPELIDITTTNSYSVNRHVWNNINKLKTKFEFRGGKTGYTSAARETSASYYSVPVSGNNRYIAIIILQSDSRTSDINTLLDFIEENATYTR